MTTLFFLLLLIPLFAEIHDILNPARKIEKLKKFKEHGEKAKELKNKKSEDNDGDFETRQNFRKEQVKLEKEVKESMSSLLGTFFTVITYLILLVVGMLMSSQWILFLVLFLIGIVSGGLKKISKNQIYHNIVTVVDSTICASLLLYIMINHFHHLDLIPLDLKGFLGMFFG